MSKDSFWEGWGGDFDNMLDTIFDLIGDFEENWKEHRIQEAGKEDEETARYTRLWCELGEAWVDVFVRTDNPLVFGGDAENPLLGMLRDLREEPEVMDFDEITTPFALKFLDDGMREAKGRAKRCVELFRLAMDVQPSEMVLQFLQRVGKCYIWGFGPECLIMCRAALEAALRDRLTKTAEETLAKNIERAYAMQVIDTEGRKAADTVRLRANKAVHYDVNATKDIIGAIRMTMKVLAQLCD